MTERFAKAGQGRPADAERAKTEVGRRDSDIFAADSAIIEASTRLGQILNQESSVRLQSSEDWIVPRPIVPDPIPLPELIAIALYQRPEISERRAEVHAAMLKLDNAKLLLFSPQFIAGFSDGAFGGGSDSNAAATGNPRFGNFADRTDLDIIMYWSIRNLGLANRALIKTATARLAATDWERTKRLNEIRAEVADAYARPPSDSRLECLAKTLSPRCPARSRLDSNTPTGENLSNRFFKFWFVISSISDQMSFLHRQK